MRIHHINCGAMQPYGGSLFDGQTPGLGPATLTCHCLVLETDAGLVLVDTGTTSLDAAAAARRHSPLFLTIDRLRLDPAEAAVSRIRALGLDPERVGHVVMTHLDFDHAAGLVDLPGAAVHLSAAEAAAARLPRGAKNQGRYRPGQWGRTDRWRTYDRFERDWYGLPATALQGLGEDILLVWLPGHTPGHCGVAVRRKDDWLLHAGDAVFHHRELDMPRPYMPPAARAYQWFMQDSQVERRRSLRALRRLKSRHGRDVAVVCTHDPSLLPTAQVQGA